MQTKEFYTQITKFPETFDNRNLEEYLLALLKIIEENKSKEFNYTLVLDMLKKAFIAEPIEFKKDWLTYNNPPDENRINKKFTHPKTSQLVEKSNASNLSPYNFTIEVLKFQIAELHKMRNKQLKDEHRYFGVQSEMGNFWYNFDPFGNLECGARCMEDNEADFDNLNWSFIGELLENGRVYE